MHVLHEPPGLVCSNGDGCNVEGPVALANLLEDIGVGGVAAKPKSDFQITTGIILLFLVSFLSLSPVGRTNDCPAAPESLVLIQRSSHSPVI